MRIPGKSEKTEEDELRCSSIGAVGNTGQRSPWLLTEATYAKSCAEIFDVRGSRDRMSFCIRHVVQRGKAEMEP